MNIEKLNKVCRDIVRKTNVPKEVGFTDRDLRILGAHRDLWLEMIYDAMGVEEAS